MIVGDALTTASDIRTDLFLSVIELNADALARTFNCLPDDLAMANPLCEFATDQAWTPAARLDAFVKAASGTLCPLAVRA